MHDGSDENGAMRVRCAQHDIARMREGAMIADGCEVEVWARIGKADANWQDKAEEEQAYDQGIVL